MKSSLNALDVAVALRLLAGGNTYAVLAEELAVSPSQVFASVRRLRYAGLLRSDGLDVNRSFLRDFVISGARFAFPARPGPVARGVATAHSAPALAASIDAMDHYVWPYASGSTIGESIEPLYPQAPETAIRSPETYRLLTLFDALRVGQARERSIAKGLLEEALSHPVRNVA